MQRCPAVDDVAVGDETLELRCVTWSDDGRHNGDHLVHTPPAMGDDHTWPNTNPLPAEA